MLTGARAGKSTIHDVDPRVQNSISVEHISRIKADGSLLGSIAPDAHPPFYIRALYT